jgi:hypothetical protein
MASKVALTWFFSNSGGVVAKEGVATNEGVATIFLSHFLTKYKSGFGEILQEYFHYSNASPYQISEIPTSHISKKRQIGCS